MVNFTEVVPALVGVGLGDAVAEGEALSEGEAVAVGEPDSVGLPDAVAEADADGEGDCDADGEPDSVPDGPPTNRTSLAIGLLTPVSVSGYGLLLNRRTISGASPSSGYPVALKATMPLRSPAGPLFAFVPGTAGTFCAVAVSCPALHPLSTATLTAKPPTSVARRNDVMVYERRTAVPLLGSGQLGGPIGVADRERATA